jgi:hypothetical protein
VKVELAVLVKGLPAASVQNPLPMRRMIRPYWTSGEMATATE